MNLALWEIKMHGIKVCRFIKIKKKSTHLHKYKLLLGSKLLHVGTDQAVVGSERWIVKTPVIQVIVSGV